MQSIICKLQLLFGKRRAETECSNGKKSRGTQTNLGNTVKCIDYMKLSINDMYYGRLTQYLNDTTNNQRKMETIK